MNCTRIIEWDMGHRVFGHEGRCNNLHGHRYRAEITCAADELDGIGRVVDFGVIKECVGGWIDREWDHQTMLLHSDPLVALLDGVTPVRTITKNPTAEVIAQIILTTASRLLRPYDVTVERVRVWETPNCYAEALP